MLVAVLQVCFSLAASCQLFLIPASSLLEGPNPATNVCKNPLQQMQKCEYIHSIYISMYTCTYNMFVHASAYICKRRSAYEDGASEWPVWCQQFMFLPGSCQAAVVTFPLQELHLLHAPPS